MQSKPEKGNAPEVAATGASSVKNQSFKEGINMSNSTVAPTNRAITVPFHGADLYVVEHNGQPYTPMKPVVSGMGLDWAAQFSKLKANPSRWGIAEIAIPTISGVQSMICLPLRKLFGWLSGINIGKIRESLRERVTVFQNECDDVLWQYWNDGIVVNPRAAYAVNPNDVLTKEQADTLRQMIEGTAKKLFVDAHQQGAFIRMAWTRLKSHFKVSYRQIPKHELTEAISIINRHTAEWDMAGAEPSTAMSLADCGDKVKVGKFLLAERKRAVQHLSRLDKELVRWELVDEQSTGVVPQAQMDEISERLTRLGKMFHPFSDQFSDILGITRALRGLEPRVGSPLAGWVELIPQHRGRRQEVAA